MTEPPGTSMLPLLREIIKQSTHELQLGFFAEIDLHKHVVCDKNPGHNGFIPIRSLEHRQFDETPFGDATEIKQFCQHVAKRTVKLKVRRVSSKRSRISNIPLSAHAGKRVTTVGSGCLTDIDVKGDKGSFPCPLANCPHSTKPHPVYGYIIITTAAHVVFDNEEAEETLVEFFDNHPTDRSTVEKAHGLSVRNVDVHGDNCELVCVTHSVSLFQQISQMVSLHPPQPDIFQFADNGEYKPTFISILSALADIRDCSRQGRLNHLYHIFSLARHEVETLCTYGKENEVMPDSEEVNAFLQKAEQVTQQNGLMEKVLSSLSSREKICDFMEISFQVIIEKVAVLGAFSLMSKAQERRLNTFVQYFFSQIVEYLNHVTRFVYQNTNNYIDNTIVVHISHPHGQSKQVSLGKYFSSETTDGQRKHVYTVPTCNGCSGGPVWILPGGQDKNVRWEQVYGVSHGGCFDRVNNLNHSSSQVFGVLHLEKFLNSLNIRPYGHLLKNIEHYQHLLNIGPHQDLPNIKHDLNVLNFILFSHPQWQDPGFNLSQQNLFFKLNQQTERSQSSQSLIPEPAQSPFRPESIDPNVRAQRSPFVFRSPPGAVRIHSVEPVKSDNKFLLSPLVKPVLHTSTSPQGMFVEPTLPTFRNSQSPIVEPVTSAFEMSPTFGISSASSVEPIQPSFRPPKRQSTEPFKPTRKVQRSSESAETAQRRDFAGTLQYGDHVYSGVSHAPETAQTPFSQHLDLQSPVPSPISSHFSLKLEPESPPPPYSSDPVQSPLSQHLNLSVPIPSPISSNFSLELEPVSPLSQYPCDFTQALLSPVLDLTSPVFSDIIDLCPQESLDQIDHVTEIRKTCLDSLGLGLGLEEHNLWWRWLLPLS